MLRALMVEEPNPVGQVHKIEEIENHLMALVLAWDEELDEIAALANTDSNFIVGNGTSWVAESAGTARTSLGLAIGTDVTAWDNDLDDIAALTHTSSNIMISNGTDWTDEALDSNGMRDHLGVAIGSDVQAYDATLADLADGELVEGQSVSLNALVTTNTGAEPLSRTSPDVSNRPAARGSLTNRRQPATAGSTFSVRRLNGPTSFRLKATTDGFC